MVSRSRQLDAALHALAHPARRAMVRRLAQGELTVGALAEPFDVSLAASSKHVRVLERAGLLRRTVVGRTHTCALVPKPLQDVADLMTEYQALMSRQFDQLDAVLRDLRSSAGAAESPPGQRPKPRSKKS